MDESQIRDILKDASFGIILIWTKLLLKVHFTLDSETVTSIIGGLMSKENRCDGGKEETKSLESPKLFNDFNISSFNISFNAGKQTRELDSVQKSSKKKVSVLQRLANRHDSRLDFYK